jgi:pimeloyl-ACP methyl ester carboxylesterase
VKKANGRGGKLRKILGYGSAVLMVAFLGLVAVGFDTRYDITIPPGTAGRHVTADGQSLRVAESGGGERSVILLHGSLGSIEDWETVVPLLERHYRVIAVDRPGHGYSAEPRAAATIELNARVVRGLIEALALKDVVVVGHSYGGAVALRLAVQDLPTLRGVVLVAPSAYPSFPASFLDRLITAPLIGRGAARLLIPVIGEARIRDGLTRAVAPDAEVLPKNFFDLRVALWQRSVPLRARAEQTLAYGDECAGMAAGYAKIGKPVVILQGEADAYPDIRAGTQRLAREIPGTVYKTYAATGHYLQYRYPQAIVEAVEEVYGVGAPRQRRSRR